MPLVKSKIRKDSAWHFRAICLASLRVSSSDPVQYTVSMSRPSLSNTTW
jgi:hypothetical protein